jgi:hypothetical protein
LQNQRDQDAITAKYAKLTLDTNPAEDALKETNSSKSLIGNIGKGVLKMLDILKGF